jgi:hypothetical protein
MADGRAVLLREGGPNDASHFMRKLCSATAADATVEAMRFEAMRFYDALTEDGSAHAAMSALIDMIAMRPR